MVETNVISIVPMNQRPFYWALNEMKEMFPEPDRFNIVGLDTEADFDAIGSHTSFFAKSDNAPRGIIRVYWPGKDIVKYSTIENLAQIRQEHPELVRRFLRNGLAAYNHRFQIERGSKTKFFTKLN